MPENYFLDANILISGLIWGGNERRVLRLGEEKKLHLVTSQYVLREVIDVLSRFDFKKEKIIEFVVYLESFIDIVETPGKEVKKHWDKLDDKGDVPVLAAVIGSKAILITGDKKLKNQAKKSITVMTAKELLDAV